MADIPELPSEMSALIEMGAERRSLEYKRSMNWRTPETKAKIVRTALAMSNLAGGGDIVLGVENDPFDPVGLNEEDFDSFSHDDLADELANYAIPPIEVSVRKGTALKGRRFVIVSVAPFREVPTVCARGGGPNGERLYAGKVYIRPEGKPETREVESGYEMQELIERATDLGIAKLRKRYPEIVEVAAVRDDAALEDELGDFA